jgi:hypothetical protein
MIDLISNYNNINSILIIILTEIKFEILKYQNEARQRIHFYAQ